MLGGRLEFLTHTNWWRIVCLDHQCVGAGEDAAGHRRRRHVDRPGRVRGVPAPAGRVQARAGLGLGLGLGLVPAPAASTGDGRQQAQVTLARSSLVAHGTTALISKRPWARAWPTAPARKMTIERLAPVGVGAHSTQRTNNPAGRAARAGGEEEGHAAGEGGSGPPAGKPWRPRAVAPCRRGWL